MICPNCQAELDREDTIRIINDKEIPAADYICPVCGAHYFWILRKHSLEVVFDPKDGNEAESDME